MEYSSLITLAQGSALGAFFGFVGTYLGKRLDWGHKRLDTLEAAYAQERMSLSAASQSLIKSLQDRLNASEENQENLWKRFREMQEALYTCEELHRRDALKIAVLEQQNADQAERIRNLERRIPSDGPYNDEG